jgi:alpha/beta superfamily hydrolase
MGTKYKKLSQSDKPKLFIQGDRDDVANFSNFQQYFDYYDDPKDFKIIEGADHFYWGYDTQAALEVFKFYQSII